MRKTYGVLLLIAALVTGCGLTGDLAPSSALGPSQAEQPLTSPTIPSPTAIAASQVNPSEDLIILGSVRGQISNGSEGGSVPDGLEVSLYRLNDQQEVLSELSTVSKNGVYEFQEVEIQSTGSYAATVEYQGVTYVSEVATMPEGAVLDLPITIFESTTNLDDVVVDRLHFVFDMPTEGVLQVTELWILSNLGNRTIASESGDGVLSIELPDDAANLSFERGMQGTRFQTVEGGFVDLFPIYPGVGTQEIVYSFNMLLDQSLKFSQSVAFPIEAIVLMTTEGVLELMGEGVQDTGIRQMSGGTLHSYNLGSLSPGETLEVTVRRPINKKTTSIESNTTLEIGIGVVILLTAFGVIGFWLYRRNRGTNVEKDEDQLSLKTESRLDQVPMDRDGMIQALADLDDEYEAAKIEETIYRERRASLKNQLLDIVHKTRND